MSEAGDKLTTSKKSIVARTLSEGVAGTAAIATMKPGDYILSAGRLMQGMFAGRFLDQFAKEWECLKEKGRIRDDYDATPQAEACLRELLDYLESEIPELERMEVLKRVFLVAATETASDREALVPQQFMQISRGLTSGEIVVMNTAYQVAESKEKDRHNSARGWLKLVAEKSGLKYSSLVEDHEESLIKKHLMTGRRLSDRSGIALGEHFRLTDLGFYLCSFIAKYDEIALKRS